VMKVVALLFGVLDNSWVELRNTLWTFSGPSLWEDYIFLRGHTALWHDYLF